MGHPKKVCNQTVATCVQYCEWMIVVIHMKSKYDVDHVPTTENSKEELWQLQKWG